MHDPRIIENAIRALQACLADHDRQMLPKHMRPRTARRNDYQDVRHYESPRATTRKGARRRVRDDYT